MHRSQIVKKINRFESLEPVIELPPGNVDGVGAESVGAREKKIIREDPAEKRPARIRTMPKRYEID